VDSYSHRLNCTDYKGTLDHEQ